jgi:hypothetical protein
MDKQHRIVWNGYCREERNAAIPEIEAIVNRFGYILDFRYFSDLTMSLVIEIEEKKIGTLYAALQTALSMEDCEGVPPESDKERNIYLHVTFLKGSGKLENEIPSVPG